MQLAFGFFCVHIFCVYKMKDEELYIVAALNLYILYFISFSWVSRFQYLFL